MNSGHQTDKNILLFKTLDSEKIRCNGLMKTPKK